MLNVRTHSSAECSSCGDHYFELSQINPYDGIVAMPHHIGQMCTNISPSSKQATIIIKVTAKLLFNLISKICYTAYRAGQMQKRKQLERLIFVHFPVFMCVSNFVCGLTMNHVFAGTVCHQYQQHPA